MKTLHIFRCNICGNIIVKLVDSGVKPFCCGKQMEELEPHTSDVGLEKHLPVVRRIDANTVEVAVGSTVHPMQQEHHIAFIALQQGEKMQVQWLEPGQEPKATFTATASEISVYEYCNIHGLWLTTTTL